LPSLTIGCAGVQPLARAVSLKGKLETCRAGTDNDTKRSLWPAGASRAMRFAPVAITERHSMNNRLLALSCSITLACALGIVPQLHAADPSLEGGAAAFHRGAFEEAATRWASAEKAYAEQGQTTNRISALINLAHAQSELGQYRRAAASLSTALGLARTTGDQQRAASVGAALGNVYVALGPPETAEQYLRDAIAVARTTPDAVLAAVALNDLGNLLATQHKYTEALASYRESIALAVDSQQSLLRARGRINAATALREEGHAREALTMLDEALGGLRSLAPSHEVAFTLVSAGIGYRDLRTPISEERDRLMLQAGTVLTYAARTAEQIGDRRAASYAWGHLGGLYEEEQRNAEALDLTRRAIFAAQQVDAPESLYRWQWQAGRLLHRLGQVDQAIDTYRRAVATLQSIRPELSLGYAHTPTSFRDSIGPVYFELVDLLLQRSRANGPSENIAPNLMEARQTMELFKVAELRDYFHDDCVDTALLKVTKLEVVAQTAVVVYPILLADRMELLVSLPSGLTSVIVPVDLATVTEEVRQFRRTLEKRTTREYIPHARKLYSWLIGPIEADLARAGVDTLVFVPDGPLRTIPMAALYDGKQFLVAKYALAITPGLDLTDPRPIRREQTKVLAVGLTEAVQGYAPLPGVAAELDALRGLFNGTTLVDRQFVAANLEDRLKAEQFSILHVASHGEFGGTPAKTFLLTFDEKLRMDRLDQFIGLFKYRDTPLELLTLSACDTAEGDDRAALGMAGVAVRAGARSAVATLWQVHDAVAADLVTYFYQQLQGQSVSRAVALQRAQLKILADPRYAHPGYWSPFLMINNWL
jgi:CHAT domain-containing protein/Tfp pilus assembly protein PilF